MDITLRRGTSAGWEPEGERAYSCVSVRAMSSLPPANAPAEKPAHQLSTLLGLIGSQFDFNDGRRAALPHAGYSWRLPSRNLDAGNILFETPFRQIASTISSGARCELTPRSNFLSCRAQSPSITPSHTLENLAICRKFRSLRKLRTKLKEQTGRTPS
jgi:hypothetical protein